ncbi:MAG: ABC transporter permease [Actinomycetales bacterium]|nr:ABC transporter permease [Actinomycetales bacterium]
MRKPDSLSLLLFVRSWGIVILFALLWGAFSIWGFPIFGTFVNFSVILQGAAISTIFAAAIAMGVFSGVLDLSVPGTAALSSVLLAKCLLSGVPMWLSFVVAIAAAVVVGLFNSFFTLRGINPLAVTIGTLSITTGAAALITTGPPLYGFTPMDWLATNLYFGLPAMFYVALVIYIIGTVFLTQTRGGGRFMAAGGNAEALRRSGVNANLYKVLGFVLSAGLAGVAGIVTTAYTTQGNPAAATDSLFTGLTAVALSGISLAGGRGSLPKVMVGALVIAEITSILNIKNIQPFWGIVITGALLIGALYLEMTIQKQVSKRVVEAKNAERQASHLAETAAINIQKEAK